MIFVLIDSFLEIAGYPNIKSSGFTCHDIDKVVFHNVILTVVNCS